MNIKQTCQWWETYSYIQHENLKQPSLRRVALLDGTEPDHGCNKLLQNIMNYVQTDKMSYAIGFEPPLIPQRQYKILYPTVSQKEFILQ
jgi:hypothetical protein